MVFAPAPATLSCSPRATTSAVFALDLSSCAGAGRDRYHNGHFDCDDVEFGLSPAGASESVSDSFYIDNDYALSDLPGVGKVDATLFETVHTRLSAADPVVAFVAQISSPFPVIDFVVPMDGNAFVLIRNSQQVCALNSQPFGT